MYYKGLCIRNIHMPVICMLELKLTKPLHISGIAMQVIEVGGGLGGAGSSLPVYIVPYWIQAIGVLP